MVRVLVPMDPNTTWILFSLTAIIHAATFFFLQHMANCFREYITATGGNGVCKNTAQMENIQNAPDTAFPEMHGRTVPTILEQTEKIFNKTLTVATTPASGYFYQNARYTPLHESLDVSIFR